MKLVPCETRVNKQNLTANSQFYGGGITIYITQFIVACIEKDRNNTVYAVWLIKTLPLACRKMAAGGLQNVTKLSYKTMYNIVSVNLKVNYPSVIGENVWGKSLFWRQNNTGIIYTETTSFSLFQACLLYTSRCV